MQTMTLDALVDPLLAEVGSHLKWRARGELVFAKDSAFLATLLAERLAKVPETARAPVVHRLASFGRCLATDQRAPEASRTFLSGLEAAVGKLPAAPAAVAAKQPAAKAKTWTFPVGRGPARRSALRGYRGLRPRG